MTAAWSPTQYLKFEDERTRPARDLLAQVPLAEARRFVDIGCGPGNSTEIIAERFPDAEAIGLDSSPEMLVAARKRLPKATFVEADIATWSPPAGTDLLYGNAIFQWVKGHLAVIERLLSSLSCGGVVALQVPDNYQEPSHTSMKDAAKAGPWTAKLAPAEAVRDVIPSPDDYYNRLKPIAARVDIWRTVYHHPLEGTGAIVEMLRSTGLRPYLGLLDEAERPKFVEEYEKRLAKAYPPLVDGKVLLRFPRLFVVAVKS
jgi:trans-aconitate 2-methyltransferase